MSGPFHRPASPAFSWRRFPISFRSPAALCLLWAALSGLPALAQSSQCPAPEAPAPAPGAQGWDLQIRLLDSLGRPVRELVEGETADLIVSVTGSFPAGGVVSLASEQADELQFRAIGGILNLDDLGVTPENPTSTLVTARQDGDPEPWELITLTVRASPQDGGSQDLERTASFCIPYNGYRVVSLAATRTAVTPGSLLTGEPVRVRAELNAPAPADMYLILEARMRDLAEMEPYELFREYELRIPAGQSAADFTVTLPREGRYKFAIAHARFNDLESESAGAQLRLPVDAPPAEIEAFDGLRFKDLRLVADAPILRSTTQARFLLLETVSEAETAVQLDSANSAALEVEHLLDGAVELTVSIVSRGSAAGAGAALAPIGGTVDDLAQSLQITLAASGDIAVRVVALKDSLKPEPAEEIVLSVSGVLVKTGEQMTPTTLGFHIPHHGYVLDMRVFDGRSQYLPTPVGNNPLIVLAGVPMGMKIFLNAEAPSDLEVIMEYSCSEYSTPIAERSLGDETLRLDTETYYYSTGIMKAGEDSVDITRRFTDFAVCSFSLRDDVLAEPGAVFSDSLGERVSVLESSDRPRPSGISRDTLLRQGQAPGFTQRYQVSLELGNSADIPDAVPEPDPELGFSGMDTLALRIKEVFGDTRRLDLRLTATDSAVRFESDELTCTVNDCSKRLTASDLPAQGVFATTLQVSVIGDELPRPRKEIQLNAELRTVDAEPDDLQLRKKETTAGGADAFLIVPRNDYAITELDLQPLGSGSVQKLVEGRQAVLGVTVNAPLPVRATVQVFPILRGVRQDFITVVIGRGESYGEANITLGEAGPYQYIVEDGAPQPNIFSSAALGDQRNLPARAPTLAMTVRGVIGLTMELQDSAGQTQIDLQEGETALLRLSVENLEPGESIDVHFTGRGENLLLVGLPEGQDLTLSHAEPSTTIETLAVQDNDAEPRMLVPLHARSADAEEDAVADFFMAREDYRVTHLEATTDARTDTGAELLIRMNGRPSPRAELRIRATRIAADGTTLAASSFSNIRMFERQIRARIDLPVAGLYKILVEEAFFPDDISEEDDQRKIPVEAPPIRLQVLDPLQFALSLVNQAGEPVSSLLEEGDDHARLQVEIVNNRAGQNPNLAVTAEFLTHVEDAAMECDVTELLQEELMCNNNESSTTVTWSQTGLSARPVQVFVLEDGLETEDTETVILRVGGFDRNSGRRAPTATLSFRIARHGYRVTTITAQPRVGSTIYRGTPVTLAVEMNQAASADARVRLEVVPPSGAAARKRRFVTIHAGRTAGDLKFRPQESGEYTVRRVAEGTGGLAPSRFLDGVGAPEFPESLQTSFQVDAEQLSVNPLLVPAVVAEEDIARLIIDVERHVDARGEVQDLRLQLAASDPTVIFSDDDLILTAPATGRVYDVPEITLRVPDDGRPNPRRGIDLSIDLLDANTNSDEIFGGADTPLQVFRHDWALSLQAPVTEISTTGPLAELRLNGPAPSTVTGTVQAVGAGDIIIESKDLFIAKSSSSQSIRFAPLPIGEYQIRVSTARFTSAAADGLDQPHPDIPPPQALRSEAVELQLEFTPQEAPREDFTVEWTLSADNLDAHLQNNSSLMVTLALTQPNGDPQQDARLLTPETIRLSRTTRMATVRAYVVADDQPEPREELVLTAEAAQAGPAQAQLFIARHGYALHSLEIALREQPSGQPFTAEAELNAPAPTTVTVWILLQAADGGMDDILTGLEISPGAASGQRMLSPPDGVYYVNYASAAGVRDARAFAADRSIGVDQEFLPDQRTDKRPIVLRAGRTLELRVSLPDGNEILEDGPRTLDVEARGLGFDEEFTLQARLLEEDEGDSPDATVDGNVDVRAFPPLRRGPADEMDVTLSAEAALSMMLQARRDGFAEPRERIEVRLEGSPAYGAAVSTSVFFFIPRHDYEMQALRIFRPPFAYQPGEFLFTLEAELNESAPATATVTVTARNSDGNEEQLQARIAPGNSTGRMQFSLDQSAYQFVVDEANFAAADSVGGDQTRIPFPFLAQEDQTLPQPTLQWTPATPADTRPTTEGRTLRWTLSVSDLELHAPENGALSVTLRLLESDGDGGRDAVFTGGVTTYTANLTRASSQTTAEVMIIEDGLPEEREQLELEAFITSLPAHSEKVGITVSRNEYEVSGLTVFPQQAAFGAPITVTVSLNATATSEARIPVHARLQGETGEFINTATVQVGAQTATTVFMLEELGPWEFWATTGTFTSFSDGDQREIRATAPVRTAQLLPQLQLDTEVSALRETGGQTTLRVSVAGPALTRPLSVALEILPPHQADLSFAEDTQTAMTAVILAAGTTSTEVRVWTWDDEDPESRETATIEGRAGGVTAMTQLRIGLNDYVVSLDYAFSGDEFALTVGRAIRARVSLNAPAPALLELRMRAQLPGSATSLPPVDAGISRNRSMREETVVTSALPEAGIWEVWVEPNPGFVLIGADPQTDDLVPEASTWNVYVLPEVNSLRFEPSAVEIDRAFRIEAGLDTATPQTATLTVRLRLAADPLGTSRVITVTIPPGGDAGSATVSDGVSLTGVWEALVEEGVWEDGKPLVFNRMDPPRAELMVQAPQLQLDAEVSALRETGGQTTLRVSVAGPALTRPLSVVLEVLPPHEADLSFARTALAAMTTVTLAAGRTSTEVRVWAWDDEDAERRETVVIEGRAGGATAMTQLRIGWNDYVVTSLTYAFRADKFTRTVGSNIRAVISLNAGAPSLLRLRMLAQLPGSLPPHELIPVPDPITSIPPLIAVPRNSAQSEAITLFPLPEAGVWEVWVEPNPGFDPPLGGGLQVDELVPEVRASTWEVHILPQVNALRFEPSAVEAGQAFRIEAGLDTATPQTATVTVRLQLTADPSGTSRVIEITIPRGEDAGSAAVTGGVPLTGTWEALVEGGVWEDGTPLVEHPMGVRAQLIAVDPPDLQLSLEDAALKETGGQTTLRVSVASPALTQLSVVLEILPPHQADLSFAEDAQTTMTTVALAAGATAAEVRIWAWDDEDPERRETAIIEGRAGSAITTTQLTIGFSDYAVERLSSGVAVEPFPIGQTFLQSVIVSLNAPAPEDLSLRITGQLQGSSTLQQLRTFTVSRGARQHNIVILPLGTVLQMLGFWDLRAGPAPGFQLTGDPQVDETVLGGATWTLYAFPQVRRLDFRPSNVVEVDREFRIEAGVNVATPQTATVEVRLRLGGTERRIEVIIPPGGQTGSSTVTGGVPSAGIWQANVLDARLEDGRRMSVVRNLRERMAGVNLTALLPPLRLHLEAQNLNQPGGWLAEGSTASWTLSAEALEYYLSGAQTLTVTVEVVELGSDGPGDARLVSPAQVVLSLAASTSTVRVELVADGAAEIGETIELRVSAAGASSAQAQAYIPRNEYRIVSARLSAERVYGEEAAYLIVKLNAAAPADSAVGVQYLGRGLTGENYYGFVADARIPASTDTVVRRLYSYGILERGRHQVQVGGGYFIDGGDLRQGNGDQFQVPADALAQAQLVYELLAGTPSLEWELTGGLLVGAGRYSSGYRMLLEGEALQLRMRADSLRAEAPLRVELELGQPQGDREDLRATTETFLLTLESALGAAELEALVDGEVEPRERVAVRLRGTAGESGSAHYWEFAEEEAVYIARHGYEAELTLEPVELLLGESAMLRARLNAPAPALSGGWVRTTPAVRSQWDGMFWVGFAEGESEVEQSFTPEQSGAYRFAGPGFLTGNRGNDQGTFALESAQGLRVWDAEEMLSLELSRAYMAEGETVTLTVAMGSLLGEERVTVALGDGGREDVVIAPAEVVLSASMLSAEAEVGLREDGRPESREYLKLSGVAQARGATFRDETAVISARHGYEAELELELSYPQEGAPARLQAEINLNAAADGPGSNSWVLLQLWRPGAARGELAPVYLASGARSGTTEWEASSAGRYRVTTVFASFGAGFGATAGGRRYRDQLELPVRPSSALRYVSGWETPEAGDGSPGSAPAPDASWAASPRSAVTVEGGRVRLELRLLEGSVPADREAIGVEAAVIAPEQARDLRVSPARLELSAENGWGGVMEVRAVHDGEAEDEETVELRLRGTDGGEQTAAIVILRNGYAVEALEAETSMAWPADEFVLKARLNAPAPAGSTVEVTVKAFADRAERASAERRFVIAPGARSATEVMTLREVGFYTLTVSSATFAAGVGRGQRELELEAMDIGRRTLALPDYNYRAGDGLSTSKQLRILNLYFVLFAELQVESSAERCTERMRISGSPLRRFHCMDVTDDGFTDSTDTLLLQRYINGVRGGAAPGAEELLQGTDLAGGTEEETAERAAQVARRIWGLHPRTPTFCAAFGIDCD